MCRTVTIFAVVMYVMVAARGNRAAAADGAAEPPVTPFIDSGNDLPDLDARARAAREAQLGPLRWYGWQLLAADLGVAACLAGTRSGWCLAPYPFAGPVIHLAHGRPGMASASISIRVGMPLTTLGLGKDHTHCEGSWDPACGLHVKDALVGAAIATLVDAALSFRRVAPDSSLERSGGQPPVIEPQLSIGRDGFSLGLGAMF